MHALCKTVDDVPPHTRQRSQLRPFTRPLLRFQLQSRNSVSRRFVWPHDSSITEHQTHPPTDHLRNSPKSCLPHHFPRPSMAMSTSSLPNSEFTPLTPFPETSTKKTAG